MSDFVIDLTSTGFHFNFVFDFLCSLFLIIISKAKALIDVYIFKQHLYIAD